MNLSIKNVPEDVVRALKERAKRNHRSLNGEMLTILEEAVYGPKRLHPAGVADANQDQNPRP